MHTRLILAAVLCGCNTTPTDVLSDCPTACELVREDAFKACSRSYQCDDTQHTNDDGCHTRRSTCFVATFEAYEHCGALECGNSKPHVHAKLWRRIAGCLSSAAPGDVRHCYEVAE